MPLREDLGCKEDSPVDKFPCLILFPHLILFPRLILFPHLILFLCLILFIVIHSFINSQKCTSTVLGKQETLNISSHIQYDTQAASICPSIESKNNSNNNNNNNNIVIVVLFRVVLWNRCFPSYKLTLVQCSDQMLVSLLAALSFLFIIVFIFTSKPTWTSFMP